MVAIFHGEGVVIRDKAAYARGAVVRPCHQREKVVRARSSRECNPSTGTTLKLPTNRHSVREINCIRPALLLQ
jgi:hypothetical protein